MWYEIINQIISYQFAYELIVFSQFSFQFKMIVITFFNFTCSPKDSPDQIIFIKWFEFFKKVIWIIFINVLVTCDDIGYCLIWNNDIFFKKIKKNSFVTFKQDRRFLSYAQKVSSFDLLICNLKKYMYMFLSFRKYLNVYLSKIERTWTVQSLLFNAKIELEWWDMCILKAFSILEISFLIQIYIF